MINERDIEDDITFLNDFKNNVVRSMNLRLNISKKRIEAIRLLEENHLDPEGIKLLRGCIRNERRFLKIIESGLKESRDKLLNIYAWTDGNIKDKEFKRKTKRLMDVVEIFYSKIISIGHRLQLEEKFINKQDKKSFKEFVKMWNKEIKLNRKLLKKIVDGGDLAGYFRKIRIIAKKVLKAGAIGGVLGAFIKKFYFVPEFTKQIPENQQILISAAVFAFMAAAATTLTTLENIEQQIEIINTAELEKAKRSI